MSSNYAQVNDVIEGDTINMKSNDTIYEDIMIEQTKWSQQEDDMEYENEVEKTPVKRNRKISEETENGWTTITKKKKIERKGENDNIEIYINCKEKLPKQFGLAKIFRDNNISGIVRIKYINAYRVRIEVGNEKNATDLEECKTFIDMGWRFQRAMENSYSYGIIKDVDLELTEDEVLKNIVCPNTAKLISLSRLNRRNVEEDGWCPSETIRLCFKGSYIPPLVYVENLSIKVEPYVFPVSQCSRCWKFGHTSKRCPNLKVTCPKCGQGHANCDTTEFKCVNCDGNHMALNKKYCSAFKKEKRLREIMSEFNCTYRRALTIYVAPKYSETIDKSDEKPRSKIEAELMNTVNSPDVQANTTPTYSEIVKTIASVHSEEKKPKRYPKKSRQKETNYETDFIFETNSKPEPSETSKPESNPEKGIKFSELLWRLREIIFLRDDTIQQKIKNVIRCCLEWVLLIAVDNIADWPLLKFILDYVSKG